jgi:dTDP-glucose 4,6-dehydratase
MRILVTGGSGFIGSNFINYWLHTYPDDTIVDLDAMTYCANPLTVEELTKRWGKRFEFAEGSICDRDAVKKVIRNAELVVNFAAESHVDRSIEDPAVFLETNVMGTHVLLSHALEFGNIRFHHVSTDEVYGSLDLDSDEKFHEDYPYDPRSPYSASKAASDHLVKSFYHTYGLPVTISNGSNNYGPYQFPEKVIPLFILRLMRDLPVPVYGDGKSVRDYIYVEDHCKAIDMIIHEGNPGETYCVGGDSELDTNQLVSLICEVLGKPEDLVVHTKDRSGHDRRYAVDHSKIADELGWEPSVSFREGLEKTVVWYRDNEDWWAGMWDECNRIAEKYLGS